MPTFYERRAEMSNKCCRIFEEQVKLLLSLPNQEEAKTVLYQAIVNSYNQFENQNENAYVSVSVSDSESISLLSKSILELLSKNIVWKSFSNNYGGKRDGAGRRIKNQIENQIDLQIDNQKEEIGQVDLPQVEQKNKDKIKKEDKNKEIIKPILEKFKNIIFTYKGREVKTNSWAKQISLMIDKDHIKPEDILKSLDWYSEHIGQPYIPVILSGESLREKYGQLEEAIKRTEPKKENQFSHWSNW